MCELASAWIQGLATIVAALIAVGAAFWGFYRQKEFELVQKRYLEEGIDAIVAATQQALNIYSHNWARCTQILKAFRDNDAVRPEELDSGFLHLPTDFALTAHYRVNQLVNSGVIWQVYQLAISFALYGSSVARDEIPIGLKVKITTDRIKATKSEIVETGVTELQNLDERSHHFQFFIGKLQDIAMLFEGQKFSFKDLRKLQTHPTVMATVKSLEEYYKDDLKKA